MQNSIKATSTDDSQKLIFEKEQKAKVIISQKGLICLLMIILALLLLFAYFHKDLFHYIMSYLTPTKIQIHQKTQPYSALIKGLKCKDDNQMFRVYYHPSDKELKNVGELITENEECDIPVLGFWDLEEMNQKWNIRYPNDHIDLNNIDLNRKEQLLVLQKLYFDGGIYINISTPLWSISNGALKYALTGLDPVYADFSEKNEKGIFVPDPRKFMRVRIAYSPVIRQMIMKLVRNEDFLDKCRSKQCLIVK